MKIVSLVFVLSCLIFFTPANAAVVIKPDNLNIAGGIFSFDFVIHDPDNAIAMSFDTTIINVSGPGTLTLDETRSEAVEGDSGYWIYDNSFGADAKNVGSNEYAFGDTADDPISEPLLAGEIVARYAFAWHTAGDYTFSLDLTDTDKNSVFLSNYSSELLQFTRGSFSGTSDSFTVHVPEPATIMLLALGGTALLKKRKRNA